MKWYSSANWYEPPRETREQSLRRQAEGMEREASALIARAEMLRRNAMLCRAELSVGA